MTTDASLNGQLFHTYSVYDKEGVDAREYVEQLLSGQLTLMPHAPQIVGPEFSWSADPLADANWRFQYHSLFWLDRLREESIKIDSRRGIELYEKLLKSWVNNNPVHASTADYSWFDMAVGMRAIVLLFALKHFGEESWLLESIRTHGEHLSDPRNYEGRGNHSLHQDMGLLAIGHCLKEAGWISLAVRRIEEMFSKAIDSQGVSREGSIDYQYRNYRWYLEASKRIQAATGSASSEMLPVLELMPEFLAYATSPSGRYALLGDTLQHQAPIIPDTPTEWLRDESKAPVLRSRMFDAGYVFARSSWRPWAIDNATSFLSLRFGPGRSTAVHGHEDAGSITLSANGEDLICDSGLFAYEAGAYRLHFRGRSSHNVVDVEGRKYYPSAESPLVAYQEQDNHILATVLIRGLQGVSWYRTVVYSLSHGYVLIDDRISNKPSSEILQRWQLPVASTTTLAGDMANVLVQTQAGNQIQFTQLGGDTRVRMANGNENPIGGWRSDDYRVKYPSPELCFSKVGDSVRLSTLIQVGKREDDLAEVVAFERTGKLLRIELSGGRWTDSLAFSSSEISIKEQR